MNETIACYVRVSTEEQSLERQLQKTTEYAESHFSVDKGDIQYYRDKSTGTDVRRSGYQSMMDDIDEIDVVIVNSVSRICRSIRDLSRTVDRFKDEGVALHILSEGLTIKPDDEDPYQTAMMQILGIFAEMEAKMTRQRVKQGIAARQQSEDYHHGRPPLGFNKEDGHLIEDDDYYEVCEVLNQVEKGEMSKRKASKQLNTSRTTISRCLEEERRELYDL